jgi:hypothetical protein
MVDIAVPGASRSWRAMLAAFAASLLLLAACSPEYDWRDVRGPGGEYWVQLPARPATMTRRIHLEGLEVEMTMQGARVGERAFTVAVVPLPGPDAEAAGMTSERILAAMREQMLRNIGAPPTSPTQAVAVPLVGADGREVGKTQLQAVSARGSGAHAAIELHGRFGIFQGRALQIVGVGPQLDPQQTEHFLNSLRLVQR